MEVKKLIVEDENGNQHEFNIVEGCGVFITDDNQSLVLPTNREEINMKLIRLILKGSI